MIHFRATGRAAYARTDEPLTAGSVGIPVDVSLSSDFDGLQSVVVFRSGDVTADVALLGQDVVVPPQVLTGRVLSMGVYASSTDGTTVIPTVWCDVGLIRDSSAIEFDPAEPTPGWSAQIQAWAEDAADSATQAASVADSVRADMDEFNETSAVVIADAQAATTAANAGAASANMAASAANASASAADAATANAITATGAANNAASAANDAAALATNAAGVATTAAGNVDTATAAARQAASDASTATVSANAAASAASAATTDTENATAAARQATADATTATADANTAATTANTAADGANDAAGAANAAASAATTAANQATAAANNANSKANLANTAANNANTATLAANDATARANSAIDAMGDISEQAVPVMSADVRGGAKIQPNSGLEISGTDNLQVRLALESEGDVRGGILGLTAKGHAEQNGTPSPDYPQKIQVVRGRNLLDESESTVGYVVRSDNGELYAVSGRSVSNFIEVEPDTDYYIMNGVGVSTHANGCVYDASKTFLRKLDSISGSNVQSGKVNVGANAAYVRINYFSEQSGAVQLILGSTPTPYVPYGHVGMEVRNPDTDELISCTAIPLPERGWVAGLPDGTADTLTVDGAGKCEWTLADAETTTAATDDVTGTIGVDVLSTTGQIADGATVLYKLATPVTEDCGYVEDWPTDIPEGAVITIPELDALGIRYFVDSAVTELARQWYARIDYERTIATQDALASVAPIEHSPAESNHSIGELVTYQGALYRVTAAIARGESIIIGTNVAATTVAEQLAALQ